MIRAPSPCGLTSCVATSCIGTAVGCYSWVCCTGGNYGSTVYVTCCGMSGEPTLNVWDVVGVEAGESVLVLPEHFGAHYLDRKLVRQYQTRPTRHHLLLHQGRGDQVSQL